MHSMQSKIILGEWNNNWNGKLRNENVTVVEYHRIYWLNDAGAIVLNESHVVQLRGAGDNVLR